jgi:hypothetical protein
MKETHWHNPQLLGGIWGRCSVGEITFCVVYSNMDRLDRNQKEQLYAARAET